MIYDIIYDVVYDVYINIQQITMNIMGIRFNTGYDIVHDMRIALYNCKRVV